MTIDLESYEAGNERRVRLCSGALVLHDGAVAVERDFSEFGSVVLEVSAQLSGRPSSGAAALSLVVERSTDGSSWTTVDTLTFSESGTVLTTDSSPAVYLRVRATGTVGLWGVSADAIPLTAGGGGGGAQPVTDTATVTTDANTFLVEHVFDLGGIAAVYLNQTVTALVPDGETFGTSDGDVAVGGGATANIQISRDGVTYYDSNPGQSLVVASDMGAVNQHRDRIMIVPRYLKVVLSIDDWTSGNVYAGANHPTATVRLDVEAAT